MSGWLSWMLVAIGGAMGSVARVGLIRLFDERVSLWGVALANIIGAFLFVVVLAGLARLTNLSIPLKTLLLSGFLGAFTTFSTFTFHTWELWQQGAWFGMLCFLVVNVMGSMLAFFLGAWLLSYGYAG